MIYATPLLLLHHDLMSFPLLPKITFFLKKFTNTPEGGMWPNLAKYISQIVVIG